MIDGFKSWHAKTDLEIQSINHNGLRLTRNVHDGYSIDGSLHKFSNDGLHNANDYFLSDLKKTLNQLFDDIALNPDITMINGFEFGVNIKLPTNPNNALQRLILHKSNNGATKTNCKEFGYKNYSFKFYNKSALTNIEPYQSGNILRVEVKVNKMRYIKNQGVYCKVLSDLLDVAVWEQLEKILIETINECLIIDLSETERNRLSDKENIKYLEYINPLFWTNLHENRKKYSRERERCNKFLNLHSSSTLKTEIINLISVKCRELRDEKKTNEILKKWDKITVFENHKNMPKWDKITIKMNSDFGTSTTTETNNVKCCKGCGKILPNPSKHQMYCSANVVGYNQAHKCRNTNSNPRNNTQRSIRRILSIPLMFDLADTIAPEKRMYL
jgi:hypothetical protein